MKWITIGGAIVICAVWLGVSALTFKTQPVKIQDQSAEDVQFQQDEENPSLRDQRKAKQQAIWREQAVAENPIIADLEKARVFVYFNDGKAVLVNYGSRKDTADGDLLILQKVPTLKTVSLETTAITGKGLMHLKKLPLLEELWLDSCTSITDEDMQILVPFPKLRVLNLPFTGVGDKALVHVARLRNLERLCLHATGITDAGLSHIAAMPKLQSLSLGYTGVTDKGLATLLQAPRLRWLALSSGKRVTKDGIREFQKALPNVEIVDQ